MRSQLEKMGDEIWTLAFPLRFLGMQLGRRVCVMRLPGDQLVIHSTAPFNEEQVREIHSLGRVEFLLEGTILHDTFSREGQRAFPTSTYLVPEHFPKAAMGSRTGSIAEIEGRTKGEIQVLRLEGMRMLNEYACFHRTSRTLIVCDLLFNLVQAMGWTRWCMRHLMGVKQWPAVDRPVRWAVKDRNAFVHSLQAMLAWDFEHVVVAHGAIIKHDGKRIVEEAIQRAGFTPVGQ